MKEKSSFLSSLARRTTEPPISWLMKLTLDNPSLISLAVGFTDNATLPVEEIQTVFKRVTRNPSQARKALQYGTTPGLPELRKKSAERLRELDQAAGIPHVPEFPSDQTIITSGSQQLLYLTAEALLDPDDIIVVEDPTYFVFLGITQSRGVRTIGVRMEKDGLDLVQLQDKLEQLDRDQLLPRLKAVYLVSYFQNPTGISTSFDKKRRLLELLRTFEKKAGHPIFVIEDAAYRELRFKGPDIASALAVNPDRVIYAGTYSKPFSTGARVGFGILPAPVHQAVLRIKGNHDFGSPNLLQELIFEALYSGIYDQHLGLLQKSYATKAATMAGKIKGHFPPETKWMEPSGGLYIWAGIPGKKETGPRSALFNKCLENGVLYVPGELCYCQDSSRKISKNEMRLSFGGATKPNIRTGIERLGQVLNGTTPGQ